VSPLFPRGFLRAEFLIQKVAYLFKQNRRLQILGAIGREENPEKVAAVSTPQTGHGGVFESLYRREQGEISSSKSIEVAIGGRPVQGLAKDRF
jgi:hypothetical protein